MSITGVRLVDPYDYTLLTDFFSDYPTVRGSSDVIQHYDHRKRVNFYTFLPSAARRLISYVWQSAVCFGTPEEQAHCALTLTWQLEHGVAGGTYTLYRDPKAPRVLPPQLGLFDHAVTRTSAISAVYDPAEPRA